MAKSNASGLLTSLDSLFTTQEQRDAAKRDVVLDLPLDQVGDFPNHPFKVRQDEAMMEMMESVQLHGVLVPGLVRQLADGSYQMVSGHRRKLASRLAGLDTLPCIVRDLTDDEAIIVMVDSNLQREKVLPSEKAFAYKMKLEAMRRQAGRPSKENGVPVGHHFQQGKSRELLAANSPDSNTQIQRYIRLTYLLPEILAMVDDSKIAFRPAVELSYLAEKEQRILYDAMGHADCTPSLAQAIKMKSFSREGKLSEAVIRSIMAEEKPNQKEQFRIPKERISKYFKPGTPARTISMNRIVSLCQRNRTRTISPGREQQTGNGDLHPSAFTGRGREQGSRLFRPAALLSPTLQKVAYFRKFSLCGCGRCFKIAGCSDTQPARKPL